MRLLKVFCVLALAGLWACGGEKVDETVKVISYNIRHSMADDGENSWRFRREATLEMLARESPDLVGMQEVLAEQYDYIAENAEGYALVGVGRDDGMKKGEMMAVAYKTGRFDKLDE